MINKSSKSQLKFQKVNTDVFSNVPTIMSLLLKKTFLSQPEKNILRIYKCLECVAFTQFAKIKKMYI